MTCSLTVLDASHNSLEGLPEGIGGCTSLVELLLSKNSILIIPERVSELQQLRTLDLRANRCAASNPQQLCTQMVTLPSHFFRITHTSFMELLCGCNLSTDGSLMMPAFQPGTIVTAFQGESSACERSAVPDDVRMLACRLTSLPVAACHLKLALLDLADNDVLTLPPQLGLMTTLRVLPLSGNPLR